MGTTSNPIVGVFFKVILDSFGMVRTADLKCGTNGTFGGYDWQDRPSFTKCILDEKIASGF